MTLSPGREPLFGLFAVVSFFFHNHSTAILIHTTNNVCLLHFKVFTVVRTYFALFAILAITSFLFRQSNAKIARKKQAVTDR